IDSSQIDVAIEFSQPDSAFENISYCINNDIPVVSGTTGWLEKKSDVEALCAKKKGAFFYASNFSLGVNIFFKLNEILAKMMEQQAGYKTELIEVHHTEKLDSPSGTAITLAERIIDNLSAKSKWVNESSDQEEVVPIISKREPNVPGTHIIKYTSDVDEIEIKHTARSRTGFALGAVLVAEWILDKKGVLSMDDFMNL
ncbi:UNVERIFIED_CONTAM: hypothetical protein GTU68_060689, partial [Idotea baltica]|nr:hypothetical protein [Idotea baltica]